MYSAADSLVNRSAISENYLVREYLIVPAMKFFNLWLLRSFVNVSPFKGWHELRDISDMLHETALEIYALRKEALELGMQTATEESGGSGMDIITNLCTCSIGLVDIF